MEITLLIWAKNGIIKVISHVIIWSSDSLSIQEMFGFFGKGCVVRENPRGIRFIPNVV